MTKQSTWLAAALAVAIAVPASAATTTPKNHSANGTLQVVTISSQGTPPNTTSTGAGIVKDALGSGAIVGTTTFSGATFTTKFRVFLVPGTLKGILSGSATANADGSATFTGTGKVTGGTGRYKGATGKFTFTGSVPANSNVATFQVKGSAKY
jgi:hypothetical protein